MKSLIAGALVAVVFVLGIVAVARWEKGPSERTPTVAAGRSNVAIVDGVQIVTVKAKGGYSPRRTVVKAGIPTIVRVETKGTFDCSSALSFPSLGIEKDLPPSGATDIDVGTLAQGTLKGTCSMGMYRFDIVAE